MIGASDLEPAEIKTLENHPIFRMDAIEMERPDVAKRLQAELQLRANEAKAWYLHIDLDVAGPEENPGNLTPAPHWPPRQHIIEAARATAQTVPVKSSFTRCLQSSWRNSNGRGARFGLDIAQAVVEGVASQASD